MSSSIRYQFVNNVTGSPFTISNFPFNGDGDDRLTRVIRRTLDAGDIGTDPGQVGDELGCIVGVIPRNYTVLSIYGTVSREIAQVDFVNFYIPNDGRILNVGGVTPCKVGYGVDKNNAIRIKDFGYPDSDSLLTAEDSVVVIVTFGNRTNLKDVLNKSDL